METIFASLIGGAVTLVGVLIANGKSQAVMNTKLEELTREVREHNNFAQRCRCWKKRSRWQTTASPTSRTRPSAWKRCTPTQPSDLPACRLATCYLLRKVARCCNF